MEIILPHVSEVKEIVVNGVEVDFNYKSIENSRYATFTIEGVGVNNIEVQLI